MTYDEQSSRREFLHQLALLFCGLSASGGLSVLSQLQALAADKSQPLKPNVKLLPWTGDDFTFGHRLRNSEVPKFPTASERNIDFVIVGGGMAALTTAHHLRNHDYLLLEQYAQTGGNARGANSRGLWYSYGSQYLTEVDGDIGELLSDLQLKPVKIGREKNAWWDGAHWLKGVDGTNNALYKDFKRLQSELGPLWKKMGNATMYVSDLTPELQKLDKVILSSMLTGYSAPFLDLMEGFLKSSMCAGVNGLSALSGVSVLEDLVIPSYLLEGGNPAITRAIAESIKKTTPQRIVTNAFVWSVNLKDDGASVVYQEKNGALHRVNCKHVIFAIPPMIAARVVSNFKVADKAQLYSFKYGSYLVGNFILNKKVFNSSFDNWLPSKYSFPDITIANTVYDLNGHYKKEMGQVLTIYQPYAPGSEGRSLLLEGDHDKFSIQLRKQLVSLLAKEFDAALETVQLTRWGHAMAITGPDYFKRMKKVLAGQSNSYSFAHSSYHGLPAAESAMMGGRIAANRALKLKAKKALLFGPMPAITSTITS
ncbi:MAG: NAD(P)-binding protein [Candidatus Melainabacteria bacterium]|nr:NAD(P)-binding protein [Candidatus Melainabacteria bacterium]